MPAAVARTSPERARRGLSAVKAYLFLLLFAFIYSPFMMLGGVQLKLPIILHFAFFLFGTPAALRMYRRYPVYRIAINILLVNAYLNVLLFLLHGAGDYDGLRLSFGAVVTMVGAAFFADRYRRVYVDQFASRLIYHIFLVGVLHAVIIVAIIVVGPFGDIMKSTFFYTEKTLELWGIRSPGLSVSGFGVLSLSQAMAGVLGVVLLFAQKPETATTSKGWILLGLVLIFLSIMVSGRTGLIALGFAFGLLLLFNAKAIYSNKKTLAILVFVLCGIIALLTVVLVFAEDSEYSNIIRWAFELYFNYEDQGELGTGSTNIVLETMFFLPDGVFSQLLGTGNFGRLDPPLHTDVGYVLIVFGAGALGLVSLMSIFIYFVVKSFAAMRALPLVANAVLLLTLMIVLANFKDPFFFHIYGTSQILFILYALMPLALHEGKKARPCKVASS